MGKAGLLKKLKPLLMLTAIWAISDEQPPSVSYTRGYAELPTTLHTFRTDNEVNRVARISDKKTTIHYSVGLPCAARRIAKTAKVRIGMIRVGVT